MTIIDRMQNDISSRHWSAGSLTACRGMVNHWSSWLLKKNEQAILVVAHEETLRIFISYFEGNVADEQLRDLHIANCEFRRYSVET